MSFKKSTHCILLYHIGANNLRSRSFSEYESVSDLVEGVIAIFEEYFKALHPSLLEVTYDLNTLLSFVDAVHDMSCLVFNRNLNMYTPYNKDWLKEKVFNHVRHQ